MSSDLRSLTFIYCSKLAAFVINSLSVIIVVPYVSSVPVDYAIYMFALSLTFILTYGDLGFMSAAQKYCAISVGAKKYDAEIKDVGYVLTLLISIGAAFSIIMILGTIYPLSFIPSLDADSKELASNIFLIIGLMMPVQVILQRLTSLILSSRLKEYVYVIFDICANLAKIIMVPYFDLPSGFALELYLLTSILLSIFSAILCLILIPFCTNFDLFRLIRHIKFSRSSFKKMRSLAFSSILSTAFFILTFECDLIIASRLFSLENVASYALALTLINFIRSASSIIYGPVIAFVNRDLGAGNREKVIRNFQEIIEFSTSLFITIVVVIYLSAEPLVIQWLGNGNPLVVEIFQVMLIGSIFVSLSNLVPLVATTYEHRIKLIISSAIPFLSFYIFLVYAINFYSELSIVTLAYAKAVALISAAVFALAYFTKISVFTVNQLKVMIYCSGTGYCLYRLVDFLIYPAYLDFLSTDMTLINFLALLTVLLILIWIFLVLLVKTTRSKFIFLCRRFIMLNL